MCTGRPKTESVMAKLPKYRDTLYPIHLADLRDILSIDVQRKVVKVEPLVTIEELVDALLALGWTLPIVPEVEICTIGGLVMGGGCETSSHNSGLFHLICVSYEMVMASGETLICSKEKNEDLFKAIPFSYGTLGFLTAVELKIVEAKRFVQLEYHAVHTYEAAFDLFMGHSNDGAHNDFVEGLAFSKDRWVVIVGKMVNSAEAGKVNEMGRWWKPWFFKHAESFLDRSGSGREYVPLKDYYFRHTRTLFWVASPVIPYGNHPIFRHLLGWTLPIDIRLVKLLTGNQVANLLVGQDLVVPQSGVSDVITECERQTAIWPLWICPIKIDKDEVILPKAFDAWDKPERTSVIGVDVGLWGIPKFPHYSVELVTKKILRVILRHHGMQSFYGDVFLSPDELGQMFNLDHYYAMRKKYGAEEAFPDIYTKVAIKSRMEGIK